MTSVIIKLDPHYRRVDVPKNCNDASGKLVSSLKKGIKRRVCNEQVLSRVAYLCRKQSAVVLRGTGSRIDALLCIPCYPEPGKFKLRFGQ